MSDLTAPQLHILQHSLGLDEFGRGSFYRNRFVAGGKDLATCQSLVDLGLMALSPVNRELTGGDPCFVVTPAGVETVKAQSPKPPKLSRAKRRYEAFLQADTGERFGEWLRRTAGAR